jgi:hypothetical protein
LKEPFSKTSVRMKLGINTQNWMDFEIAQYQVIVNSELLHHLFKKTKDYDIA